MDIKDLQNLIKFVSKADVAGVKYKTKDFEINITNHTFGTVVTTPQMTQVQPVVNAAPVAQPEQESSANSAESAENGKYITDKDPFVSVGSEITEGTVVCVVEAMKLFNQIESEVSGKIVKILVDDASPVEYDQPLFLVDPS